MYVLIVLVLAALPSDQIVMQDFTSLANCEAAATIIKTKRSDAQPRESNKELYKPFTICLPK